MSSSSHSSRMRPPLRRSRTDSSYYSFNGVTTTNANGDQQAYIRASEARAQVSNAPPPVARFGRGYPNQYRNLDENGDEAFQFNVSKPYHHLPAIPGQEEPWAQGQEPGPVRLVYNDSVRDKVNVIVHDPGRGHSRRGHAQYTSAAYHAAVSESYTPQTTPIAPESYFDIEPHEQEEHANLTASGSALYYNGNAWVSAQAWIGSPWFWIDPTWIRAELRQGEWMYQYLSAWRVVPSSS